MTTQYKARIALVDDDPEFRILIKNAFEGEGFQVEAYSSPFLVVQRFREFAAAQQEGGAPDGVGPFDVVISDLKMPQMDGLELVKELQPHLEKIPFILITAHGSLETAIEAIRLGAFDYIVKPFRVAQLKVSIERALRFNELERENELLRSEVKRSWRMEDIVGKSDAIKRVFDLIQRVAPTDANVLISGESGTGKELVARAIHRLGPRAEKPFVAINCSAIPENLLESELFGYGKGAFTGAIQQKKGLFEEADTGTIFLDEIGDMPPALQAKLLRVLQDRTIRPVGQTKEKKIDVRIISATHRNLREAIKKGDFREDLYYRLSVLPIELPPLRERREDVAVLAEHFLNKFCASHGRKIKGFGKKALEKMMAFSWPGNVRELENAIERAVILTEGDRVDEVALILEEPDQAEGEFNFAKFPRNMSLRDLEKRYIKYVLDQNNGVKEKAARILGIDRKTLYRKEKDYGLNGGVAELH